MEVSFYSLRNILFSDGLKDNIGATGERATKYPVNLVIEFRAQHERDGPRAIACPSISAT